nr:MAG TPA: hypothetical protein [Caudoviricetes sp.]
MQFLDFSHLKSKNIYISSSFGSTLVENTAFEKDFPVFMSTNFTVKSFSYGSTPSLIFCRSYASVYLLYLSSGIL